jgi:hypothetical protein
MRELPGCAMRMGEWKRMQVAADDGRDYLTDSRIPIYRGATISIGVTYALVGGDRQEGSAGQGLSGSFDCGSCDKTASAFAQDDVMDLRLKRNLARGL